MRKASTSGGLKGSSCSKIAEAEATMSFNEMKWLVMHMHVQLKLDELRGPPTLGSLCHKVPGREEFWTCSALDQ
jgi:hypothetical protein